MQPFCRHRFGKRHYLSVVTLSKLYRKSPPIRDGSAIPAFYQKGACNQGKQVFCFYCEVVTRRHSFGFSRKQQKWKILIFRFCCCQGLRDEVPNKSLYIEIRRILYIQVGLLNSQAKKALPFLRESKKWVSAPLRENLTLHIRCILAHKHICGIQV